MKQLTEEQLELIEHLFSGGEVTAQDPSIKSLPKICTLSELTLACIDIGQGEKLVDINPANFLTIGRIYKDAKTLRIEELERQLAIQSEELQKLCTPPPRKHRAHVTKEEAIDIEEALAKDVPHEQIMATYDLTENHLYQFRRHLHKFSTPLIAKKEK